MIIQFINQLVGEGTTDGKAWNLEQFVMPPTERGQDADTYIRAVRDNDRC